MKFATPASIATATLILAGLGACTPTPEPPAKGAATVPAPKAEQPTPGQITEPVPMAYEEPVVGGAVMSAGKDLLSNLAKSRDHTTLLKAIQASGHNEILTGSGPFTLFAPTNAAFDRLPPGTLDNLLKPENRSQLIALLNYHIVPERLDARELESRMLAANGDISLQTIDGPPLRATVGNGKAMVVDTSGGVAGIAIANVVQTNGVMHVIDAVMMPKKTPTP